MKDETGESGELGIKTVMFGDISEIAFSIASQMYEDEICRDIIEKAVVTHNVLKNALKE